MNGGRPTGTIVRQSNGVVVPTFDEPTLPAVTAKPNDAVGLRAEACTMGGGRPTGAVIIPGGSAAPRSAAPRSPASIVATEVVGTVVPTKSAEATAALEKQEVA